MSVFNSLGSNYSTGFILKNLIGGGSKKDYEELAKELGGYYKGQAILTYKGRNALELALRSIHLPAGSSVGINGLTCYVVYQAVISAGLKPIMIDLAARQLNFDIDELRRNKDMKAIIVQNTLGYPANIAYLKDYCSQEKIIIIEDLAHSSGAIYPSGEEAGTVGELTMMSFSQDKPLDAVAGGALIDRRPNNATDSFISLPKAGTWPRTKNRFYPFWTMLIRNTYDFGLGRALHYILKRFKLLSTPMASEINSICSMSNHTAKLIVKNLWPYRNQELSHRQKIAEIYHNNLPDDILITPLSKSKSSYLRFPILVPDRSSLLNYLRKNKIFISDTWYDAPIGPKKYLGKTSYKTGQCPRAELIASKLINLPTHRHITPDVALIICDRIKQWQKS